MYNPDIIPHHRPLPIRNCFEVEGEMSRRGPLRACDFALALDLNVQCADRSFLDGWTSHHHCACACFTPPTPKSSNDFCKTPVLSLQAAQANDLNRGVKINTFSTKGTQGVVDRLAPSGQYANCAPEFLSSSQSILFCVSLANFVHVGSFLLFCVLLLLYKTIDIVY